MCLYLPKMARLYHFSLPIKTSYFQLSARSRFLVQKQASPPLLVTNTNTNTLTTCLDVEREARDSERAAPSATARSFATTSRVSPSPPSAASRAVVVSSASAASSTRRPAVSSRSSSRTSSVTPSPTPSTPAARPSPPWTSSTRSSARAAPSTASAAKCPRPPTETLNYKLFKSVAISRTQQTNGDKLITTTPPKKQTIHTSHRTRALNEPTSLPSSSRPFHRTPSPRSSKSEIVPLHQKRSRRRATIDRARLTTSFFGSAVYT